MHRVSTQVLISSLVFAACAPERPRKPTVRITAGSADCSKSPTAPECAGASAESGNGVTPPSSVEESPTAPVAEGGSNLDAKGTGGDLAAGDDPAAGGDPAPGGDPVPGGDPAPGDDSDSPPVGGVDGNETESPDAGMAAGNPAAPTGGCLPGQLEWKNYFRPQVNEPNKSQGGWNKVCAELHSGAGDPITTSVCNKRMSNSCWLFNSDNQGVGFCVDADQVSAGIDVTLNVTFGAQPCTSGTVDNGFKYEGAGGVGPQVESFSSKSHGAGNSSRFKCKYAEANGTFKYKICLEDNAVALNPDPSSWDYSDFIVILTHEQEINLPGLICAQDDSILNMPDDSCASSP
jgi:hypothetical protein